MKFFTIPQADGDDLIFTGIRNLRNYLKAHPEILTVERQWFVGNDYVGPDTFTRDQILKTPAKQLQAGQTLRWAYDHHTLNED